MSVWACERKGPPMGMRCNYVTRVAEVSAPRSLVARPAADGCKRWLERSGRSRLRVMTVPLTDLLTAPLACGAEGRTRRAEQDAFFGAKPLEVPRWGRHGSALALSE